MGWSVERIFRAPVFTLFWDVEGRKQALACCPHTVVRARGVEAPERELEAFSRRTLARPASKIGAPRFIQIHPGYTPIRQFAMFLVHDNSKLSLGFVCCRSVPIMSHIRAHSRLRRKKKSRHETGVAQVQQFRGKCCAHAQQRNSFS